MTDQTGNSELQQVTVLRQAEAVMACRVGSDLVLLDTTGGRYFGLDEVGASMFELVGAGKMLGDIHRELSELYDVQPDQLWRDLVEFCDRMLSLGLFVNQAS